MKFRVLAIFLISFVSTAGATCSDAPGWPITLIDLPGRPFEPVTTADGCWIFVSILGSGPRGQAGIAIVGRSGGKFQLEHVVPVNDPLSGMALTHDGKLLIAGIGNGVSFLNPASPFQGKERRRSDKLGPVRKSPAPPI